jgi:hypothetical protein
MRRRPEKPDRFGRPTLFDQDAVDAAGRTRAQVADLSAASPAGVWPATGAWPTTTEIRIPELTGTEPVSAGPPRRGLIVRWWQRRRIPRRPWLADQIGPGRRLRSVVELMVINVVLGVVIAAILGIAIGAIVITLQHALKP